MPESPRQSAISALRFARKITNDLITNFPEGKGAFQTCPTDNHLLWNLGHLAKTYQWCTGLLGGDPGKLPDAFESAFGSNPKPSSDPKAYPPLADVRGVFDDQYNRFIATAEKLPEASLSDSLADQTGGFASTKLDLIHKAAWHEGWHAGQISSLRRALNLPGVMG
jgi:hypothetical protein